MSRRTRHLTPDGEIDPSRPTMKPRLPGTDWWQETIVDEIRAGSPAASIMGRYWGISRAQLDRLCARKGLTLAESATRH